MNELQETALVRRCQAGDKEAFRMLVEQYRSLLFGTAYLMLRDRGLAEDAVQEALMQIWKHLSSFRLKSSIKTWLVRIVINEVKQQLRKKRPSTIPLESLDEETGRLNEAETALIRSEERINLGLALNRLSPDQREAVVLHYYSELTVPEIATATKQREGTIKARLSRALDLLNEILSRDGMWEGRK